MKRDPYATPEGLVDAVMSMGGSYDEMENLLQNACMEYGLDDDEYDEALEILRARQAGRIGVREGNLLQAFITEVRKNTPNR